MASMTKTSLYLPAELQRRLRDEARRRRRPQAELVRDALQAYLDRSDRPVMRSIGIGSDPELSGRDVEEWLEREWGGR